MLRNIKRLIGLAGKHGRNDLSAWTAFGGALQRPPAPAPTMARLRSEVRNTHPQKHVDDLYALAWMVANYGGEIDASLRSRAVTAVKAHTI